MEFSPPIALINAEVICGLLFAHWFSEFEGQTNGS
jgi:hypothetical protein